MRRSLLTASAPPAALVTGRDVGTSGVAADWVATATNPLLSATTLTKVSADLGNAGVTLYFFIFNLTTGQVTAVASGVTSVVGPTDYALSLPVASGQSRLGCRSASVIQFRYDASGGNGFSYTTLGGSSAPVVGSAFPAGTSTSSSPTSLNLAGFA